MRSSLVFVHLLFVGIWLGCVLTEALFERALLGQGPAQELLLAGLHKKVDLWVEIPAFTLVLLSGAALMASAWARAPGWALAIKICLGLLAMGANAYCVRLVWRRAAYAQARQWAAFRAIDQQQHRWGALVLFSMLLALLLGGSLRA